MLPNQVSLAYSVETGPVPGNLAVAHICNRATCCNPAHLRAVASCESVVNTKELRRGAYGPANSRTVRSWEDVQAIRAAYASGTLTMAEVGKQFGVSTSMVSLYVNRIIRKYA